MQKSLNKKEISALRSVAGRTGSQTLNGIDRFPATRRILQPGRVHFAASLPGPVSGVKLSCCFYWNKKNGTKAAKDNYQ
ncbi:hypothetical protein [Thiohalophilus thiocyanatoxydans]|uniref:hypothetical protein n=1 Tax=Thiohalophilus thiocyanatoxydans TaxID=381308 RepID=UPI0010663EED|nr:hypothetical protein [Thiohalophilus thiocyanatoxydans]